MKRIAIDTQIIDKISEDPRLVEEIKALGYSQLVIVLSHILRDELGAVPDPWRREKLLRVLDALPKENVATHGVVPRGRSALRDALVATTASGEADVLVTDDTDLAKKVGLSTARCEIWSFQDFVHFVRKA